MNEKEGGKHHKLQKNQKINIFVITNFCSLSCVQLLKGFCKNNLHSKSRIFFKNKESNTEYNTVLWKNCRVSTSGNSTPGGEWTSEPFVTSEPFDLGLSLWMLFRTSFSPDDLLLGSLDPLLFFLFPLEDFFCSSTLLVWETRY